MSNVQRGTPQPQQPVVIINPGPRTGVGPWTELLASRPGLALVDAAVAERVSAALPRDCVVLTVERSPSIKDVEHTVIHIKEHSPRTVLAVGGGATMDLAKLAVLAAETPRLVEHLQDATREDGLVPLHSTRRSRRLILAPTTPGTGSEMTIGACVDHPLATGERARSLVTGTALGADLAWIDAELLTTLPTVLVREGAVEALSRVLVSSVATPTTLRPADWEAHALARHLTSLLLEVNSVETATFRTLQDLALTSGQTHRGLSLTGRGPAPSPVWFIATELSMVLGVRKDTALSALLAQWIRLVSDGVEAWGDAEVLEAILPADSPGRWALTEASPLPAPPGTVWRTIERVRNRWGGQRPMMGRFRDEEIAALLEPAVQTIAQPVRRTEPAHA